jgi:putative endonuclease
MLMTSKKCPLGWEKNLFIEVKTRSSSAFGPPQLAVHYRKQQQIVRTAQWFLAERRIPEVACRFDVLAVTFPKGEEIPRIDWLRDAFPAEGVQVW